MNELEYLARLRGYHQRLADQYGKLLQSLGEAPSGPESTNGSHPPVKGGKGRSEARDRVVLPLRAKRLAAGITIAEFAERLGLSESYISQVESGYQKAKEVTVQHWEAILAEMIAAQALEPHE